MNRKQRRAASKWSPDRLGPQGTKLTQTPVGEPVRRLAVLCAGEPPGICSARLLIPVDLPDAEALRLYVEGAGGALALSGAAGVEEKFYSILCPRCAAELLGVNRPMLVPEG